MSRCEKVNSVSISLKSDRAGVLCNFSCASCEKLVGYCLPNADAIEIELVALDNV